MTNVILWVMVYLLCGFLCGTIAARTDALGRDAGESFFITLLFWPIYTISVVGEALADSAERYVKWIREPFENHGDES